MASDLIERLTKERDEAQSACTAWQGIYEGLEAHLQDRVNMGDEAKPEVYLYILRGYVANIIRDSRAICASRWADYGRHETALRAAEASLAEAKRLLKPIAALAYEAEIYSYSPIHVEHTRAAARFLVQEEGRPTEEPQR